VVRSVHLTTNAAVHVTPVSPSTTTTNTCQLHVRTSVTCCHHQRGRAKERAAKPPTNVQTYAVENSTPTDKGDDSDVAARTRMTSSTTTVSRYDVIYLNCLNMTSSNISRSRSKFDLISTSVLCQVLVSWPLVKFVMFSRPTHFLSHDTQKYLLFPGRKFWKISLKLF